MRNIVFLIAVAAILLAANGKLARLVDAVLGAVDPSNLNTASAGQSGK